MIALTIINFILIVALIAGEVVLFYTNAKLIKTIDKFNLRIDQLVKSVQDWLFKQKKDEDTSV